MRAKLWVSWSTGKDSAWALQRLHASGEYEIAGLFTTYSAAFGRVAMHGVRRELAAAQAHSAGLPLRWVKLPHPCSNADYEASLGVVMQELVSEGASHVAFGDLFLRDIRAYRERMLTGSGITPVFPLWHADTAQLARQMTASGLRAVLVCVDPKQLPPIFAGRTFDDGLLADLPPGVDACGENGEFHTFCFAGPMFREPIRVHTGATVERDGFVFTDLLPATAREGTCA
jgi:uncharacterized protein (TIGR00290 family)